MRTVALPQRLLLPPAGAGVEEAAGEWLAAAGVVLNEESDVWGCRLGCWWRGSCGQERAAEASAAVCREREGALPGKPRQSSKTALAAHHHTPLEAACVRGSLRRWQTARRDKRECNSKSPVDAGANSSSVKPACRCVCSWRR